MNIDNISFLNIEDMYNILADSEYNISSTHGYTLGKLYYSVLNNVEITVSMSNVNIIEYLFLKMKYSNVYTLEDFTFDSDYSSTMYREVFSDIKPLHTTLSTSFKEHTKMDFSSMILPLGTQTSDVILALTGNDLISIIGNDIATFFKMASPECVEEVDSGFYKLKKGYHIENDSLRGYISDLIVSSFYKFMLSDLAIVDTPSEIFLDKTIQSSISNSRIGISSIVNPHFSLNLNRDGDKIVDTFNLYKKKGVDTGITLNQTRMRFVMVTPLIVFIELLNIIPKSKFIFKNLCSLKDVKPYESYKELPSCPDSISALKNIYNNKLKKMIDSVYNTYVNDNVNIIQRIYLSYGFEDVAYEIDFSFNDINSLLVPVLNSEIDTYAKQQVCDYIRDIIDYAKIVSSSII